MFDQNKSLIKYFVPASKKLFTTTQWKIFLTCQERKRFRYFEDVDFQIPETENKFRTFKNCFKTMQEFPRFYVRQTDFHVVFNPSFHTMNQGKVESKWQYKTGFKNDEHNLTPIPISNKPTSQKGTPQQRLDNKIGQKRKVQQQLQKKENKVVKVDHKTNDKVIKENNNTKIHQETNTKKYQTRSITNIPGSMGSTTTRYGRITKPVERLMMAMEFMVRKVCSMQRTSHVQSQFYRAGM